jgi:hypothetical protein
MVQDCGISVLYGRSDRTVQDDRGGGAAPRHYLASGPPTERTKSVPNTGKYTGISRY